MLISERLDEHRLGAKTELIFHYLYCQKIESVEKQHSIKLSAICDMFLGERAKYKGELF